MRKNNIMTKEKKQKSKKITVDMSIGKVLEKYPKTAAIFGKHGLHCIGCQIAAYEDIRAGAAAHGVEIKALMDDLNKMVAEEEKNKENK